MADVRGTCDPRFEKLKELLQGYLASGEEIGASIYVDIDGKPAVDIIGGYVDEAHTSPWKEDTITCVWSTSKCITNLSAIILMERGLLDPNAKVSKYWPEFAVNGKEDILVRHFLMHTSGLSGFEKQDTTMEDYYNTAYATKLLEQQAPFWEPGTASGYHALTQGFLVGELVRRVTGKSLTQFIEEEVAGPLNADFQLGAKEIDWPRISNVIAPPARAFNAADVEPDSVLAKTARGIMPLNAEVTEIPEFRKAELGGSNGFASAKGVAKIMSMISLGGEVDGKKFLSPSTIDLIFQNPSEGMDYILQRRAKLGLGYGLPLPEVVDWIPAGRRCFWSGWGGSMAISDLDNRMTFCYVMNKMDSGTVGNPRTEAYIRAVYEAVKASA